MERFLTALWFHPIPGIGVTVKVFHADSQGVFETLNLATSDMLFCRQFPLE